MANHGEVISVLDRTRADKGFHDASVVGVIHLGTAERPLGTEPKVGARRRHANNEGLGGGY